MTTTRSLQDSSVNSPPRKRRHTTNFEGSVAPFATNLEGNVVPFAIDLRPRVTTPQNNAGFEVHSTLPGLILPDDFQRDPRFQYDGPNLEGVFTHTIIDSTNNAMEALLDALTPATSPRNSDSGGMVENLDQPRRSTRVRIQPQMYQSDEVERQERNTKH